MFLVSLVRRAKLKVMMKSNETRNGEIAKIKEALDLYKKEGTKGLKELRQYMQDSSQWLEKRVQK